MTQPIEITEETPSIPLTPLVVQLMEKSARDLEWTTHQVIESLTARAERAEATLQLVRDRISDLLEGPYMPTPRMLERALYPPQEVVDAAVAEEDTAA